VLYKNGTTLATNRIAQVSCYPLREYSTKYVDV